jgi:hypothetical protein
VLIYRIAEKGDYVGNGEPAEGKMDTQLFPKSKGTKYDRDVVKKNRKRKKKSCFNLKDYNRS